MMANWLRVISAVMLWAASVAAASAADPAGKLGAAEAHAAAVAGKVVVIDIRTPEEWAESGLPASGHAISMDQQPSKFLQQLSAVTANDKTRPIALICATGNRSAALQKWLVQAGYTAVSDIAEGMIGGRHGRGWIKSGLPLRKWLPGQSAP